MLLVSERVGNDHLKDVFAKFHASAKLNSAAGWQSLQVGLAAAVIRKFSAREDLFPIAKQFDLGDELRPR